MKKTLILPLLMCAFVFSSCYTSRVAHGNMTFEEPAVKVNSKKNQTVLWGLVSVKSDQKASTYIGDRKDYITKRETTFVDGLLNFLTVGIYNPSTTSYYVPFK